MKKFILLTALIISPFTYAGGTSMPSVEPAMCIKKHIAGIPLSVSLGMEAMNAMKLLIRDMRKVFIILVFLYPQMKKKSP